MREKEKENRMGCMQAQAETTSQEQKLAGQAGAASDAQARERDAKSVLEACHEDTERGRTELRDRYALHTTLHLHPHPIPRITELLNKRSKKTVNARSRSP